MKLNGEGMKEVNGPYFSSSYLPLHRDVIKLKTSQKLRMK